MKLDTEEIAPVSARGIPPVVLPVRYELCSLYNVDKIHVAPFRVVSSKFYDRASKQ